MDHSAALQFFSSELKQVLDENQSVMVEYRSVKKEIEEITNETRNKNQTILRGSSRDVEDLNKEITCLEEELSKLEIECAKEAELLAVEQKKAEDHAREMKMLNDFKAQYSHRLAKASAKSSKKDLELLEKYKKKLEAYVKFTGVVWDFDECDEKTLSGYIRNAADTKMKKFTINIAGKSREEISEEMWKLIKKYVSS